MRALQANFIISGICMCSTELLLTKLPQDFTEMRLHCWHSPRGGFREGAKEARAPPSPHYFFWNCAQVKNTETNNINKIYPTELRLKEMTCSMIIAETIKPSNSSINSICITVQESPLRKNNSSGTKAATERCF